MEQSCKEVIKEKAVRAVRKFKKIGIAQSFIGIKERSWSIGKEKINKSKCGAAEQTKRFPRWAQTINKWKIEIKYSEIKNRVIRNEIGFSKRFGWPLRKLKLGYRIKLA